MLNTIKNIFGFGPKTDYAQLLKEGAIILDVRSKGEFSGGHIKGSVNIPVDQPSRREVALRAIVISKLSLQNIHPRSRASRILKRKKYAQHN